MPPLSDVARKRIGGTILFCILSWPLISGVIGVVHNYWLLNDCEKSKAYIIGASRRGHAVYNYKYTIENQEFSGASRRNYKDEKSKNAGTGDSVAVYYSKSHPWISSLYKPDALIVGLPFFAVIIIMQLFALITVINPHGKWALNL